MKIDDVRIGQEYEHESWGRVKALEVVTEEQTIRDYYGRPTGTRNVRRVLVQTLDEKTGAVRELFRGLEGLDRHTRDTPARALKRAWSEVQNERQLRANAERPAVEVATRLRAVLEPALAAAPGHYATTWDRDRGKAPLKVNVEHGHAQRRSDGNGVRVAVPDTAYVQVTLSLEEAALLAELVQGGRGLATLEQYARGEVQ